MRGCQIVMSRNEVVCCPCVYDFDVRTTMLDLHIGSVGQLAMQW